jgi:hypothetical protein
LEHLDAVLYNCLDSLPSANQFDRFYTNPPWGASNEGESVCVFMQRGMEAVGYSGEGLVVIADDNELEWPKRVLARVQQFAIQAGFFVQKMMPKMHLYHLDDAPNLRSCNLIFHGLPDNKAPGTSAAISDAKRLAHFYGRGNNPRVRYVREKKRLDYGTAHENEYLLELLE